ncbi:hypothetical protein V2J09_007178, partial [Rumex salicifolius]
PQCSRTFLLRSPSSFLLRLFSSSVPQFFVFNSSPVGFFSSSTSSSSIRLRWACLQFVSGGPVVFFSCSSSSSSVRLFFVKVIQFVLQLFVCSSSIRLRRQFVVSSSVLRLFVWWWVFVFDSPTSFKIEEEGNCSGEISAQINSNSTPHRNCSGSSGIRRRAEKNLLRICRAFSGVGAAQFPWVKIFRESTLAKITEDT